MAQPEKRIRRVTVNLRDSDYRRLRRLSKANGQSISRNIAELVEIVSPSLDRVAGVLEVAATAQEETLVKFRERIEVAESVMTPLVEAMQAQMDDATRVADELGDEGEPPGLVITGGGLDE